MNWREKPLFPNSPLKGDSHHEEDLPHRRAPCVGARHRGLQQGRREQGGAGGVQRGRSRGPGRKCRRRRSHRSAAPAGDQTNQNFTLVNNTGHTVVTLNVSPNNENAWGPDILGADTLANGQTAAITFPRGEEQCSWDIRATYDDGDTTDARGVDLCQIATVTLTANE